jgi:type IV secretion system protein VirB9
MKIYLALLAATLSLTLGAHAMAKDARLSTRPYNANEIVVLPGRVGVQATIIFGDDEHIENVAIGDSNSWQVTPNKRANLLFVKPLAAQAQTNLTVVTDRHTYLFDLVAGSGVPHYVLRFTYPDAVKAKALAVGAMSAEEAEAAKNPNAVKGGQPPSALNFAWTSKGSARILPTRIYDDGVSTYLSWAKGRPVPAILLRDDKGAEGATNYAVRGDLIVLDNVPKVIVLRAGIDVATLKNQGPVPSETASADPNPQSPVASDVKPPPPAPDRGQ